MFGMGGSEILVILVVALLFLGPEKLPDAARMVSKGIRDLRKSTRELQQTIENDTQLGGAIRDIKSALRGDEPKAKIQPRPPKPAPPPVPPGPEAEELPTAETAALAPAETAAAEPEVSAEPDDAALAARLIRPAVGNVASGEGSGEGPDEAGPQG